MRKVKLNKKWKKQKPKTKKIKLKYFRKFFLLLYILLIPLLIFQIIKRRKNKSKLEKYMTIPSKDEMYFKGEKVSKSKLIDDYLMNITDKYKYDKNEERQKFNFYYYLPEYSDAPEIQKVIRKKFYELISQKKKKTINKIDKIYLERNNPFGNNVPCINNAIFYCEVLGCNQIILRNGGNRRRWLITKPVYIEKLNITITQGSNANCHSDDTICIYKMWDLLYPFILKPEIRIQYIKDEVLRNLPNVNIDPDDLYIHIRGGDIFTYCQVKTYAQPPYCFYERIINTTKYKNIYILSIDKKNPVLRSLIKNYQNVIYEKHHFEYDISLLAHAFNVVLSISSFSISAIKFNDNLKNVYEYDIYHLSEMFTHLHHYVYKLDRKFEIHSMKPSERYKSKMFSWSKTSKKIFLMLEDKCPYDFVITKPNR